MILNKPWTLLFYLNDTNVALGPIGFSANDPSTSAAHPEHFVELILEGAVPAEEV